LVQQENIGSCTARIAADFSNDRLIPGKSALARGRVQKIFTNNLEATKVLWSRSNVRTFFAELTRRERLRGGGRRGGEK